MINALKGLGHNQFEFARWAPEKYNRYKIIRVEVVSENEKRWSTVIQNLITVADSTLIRTAFVYDYKPGQHIFFRNKWWEIRSVGEMTGDVNPQALSLVNGGNTQYVLELTEVNGFDVE
ncbi:MAG: hypothetical protein J1G01_04525 [Clostridiales bacterium]|nr:hypothetical protein [Clostridiales bacterium]